MTSRRYTSRPSGGSHRRRDEPPIRSMYEEPARFSDYDVKGTENRHIDISLSARDRIRMENHTYDHKGEIKPRSRRHASLEPIPRDDSRSRIRRSRSPGRRGNEKSRLSREPRGIRSKERDGNRNREFRERSYDRKEEERFRFEEFNDKPKKDYHRFSPPPPTGYFEEAIVAEIKPNYSEEVVIEYPESHTYRGHPVEIEEPTYMERNSLHLNVPSLMEQVIENPQSKSEQQNNEKIAVDMSGPLIPDFNPELSKLSPFEWLQIIENTAVQYNWQGDEKQYIMTSRLSGYARQWYLSTGIKYKTWKDLKAIFLQTFSSDMNYYQLLTKMLAREKEEDESMAMYFQHKVALLNACEIQGRKAVSCILGGIRNKRIQDQTKTESFEDPDELYLFLRANNVEAAPSQQIGSYKKCFVCKETGHLKMNCPNRSKLDYDKHAEKEDSLSLNKVMFGSLSNKPTHPKHYTEVVINGKTLNAYVDLTSEVNTIRQSTVNQLSLIIKKNFRLIRGFSGNSLSSIGIVEVTICVDRIITNIQLSVISDHLQAIPIILGQNFIEKPNIGMLKDADRIRFYQRADNGPRKFNF